MTFLRKNIFLIIGIIIGAIGGFLYYHLKGCPNGTCAITSSPVNSSLYGAIMGGLLVSSFKKETNKK